MTALARRRAPPATLHALAERGLTCPRCETRSLVELERDGVVIDRCARCRGVWLDRGELEHLLALARERAGDDDGTDDEATRPVVRLDLDAAADDEPDRVARPRRRSWWDLFD